MDFIKEEYESKKLEVHLHLENLQTVILNSNLSSELEGNCFYYNATLNLYPELYSKQLNLFFFGKESGSRMCEIGFNAGHSLMLLLLGNQNSKIDFTIFDIGHHKYTKPCLEYIKSKFLNVNFEYIEGDSTITIPDFIIKNNELIGTYDLVHVDGGHFENCVVNDMKNAEMLVKINGIIIVDDTNNEMINKYVDLYISTGNYIELSILETYGYRHRVIKKIK